MAAVIILALAMRSRAAAARVGGALGVVVSALRRLVRKPAATGWPDAAVRFSADTSELVAGRWLLITAATLVSHQLGYAAILGVGLDDPARAQVVAAVLVFRFITYFVPIPLGSIAYVIRRRKGSWRVVMPAATEA